jgi:hypothetical protein
MTCARATLAVFLFVLFPLAISWVKTPSGTSGDSTAIKQAVATINGPRIERQCPQNLLHFPNSLPSLRLTD